MQTRMLMIDRETIIDHLIHGGFLPMTDDDYQSYLDAPRGSLIATITRGRFSYEVIFVPQEGRVEIYYYGHDIENADCWSMNLGTGDCEKLN